MLGEFLPCTKKNKKKNRESNFIAQTIVFQLFQSKADIIGKITLY